MPFRFKQFSLDDDISSMTVGTDAVLLGAWTNPVFAKEILEIGTGCGVIALMLTQRSHASVTAIDIHKDSIRQASLNFQNSPWNERLKTIHISVQEYAKVNPGKFDLIVINPPFFSNSLKSPLPARNLARHDDLLPLAELMKGVSELLRQGLPSSPPSSLSKFGIIIPFREKERMIREAKNAGLYLHRQLTIKPKSNKAANRIAMEFSLFEPEKAEEETLTIRHEDNRFTEEYIDLTRDYYLNF